MTWHTVVNCDVAEKYITIGVLRTYIQLNSFDRISKLNPKPTAFVLKEIDHFLLLTVLVIMAFAGTCLCTKLGHQWPSFVCVMLSVASHSIDWGFRRDQRMYTREREREREVSARNFSSWIRTHDNWKPTRGRHNECSSRYYKVLLLRRGQGSHKLRKIYLNVVD